MKETKPKIDEYMVRNCKSPKHIERYNELMHYQKQYALHKLEQEKEKTPQKKDQPEFKRIADDLIIENKTFLQKFSKLSFSSISSPTNNQWTDPLVVSCQIPFDKTNMNIIENSNCNSQRNN